MGSGTTGRRAVPTDVDTYPIRVVHVDADSAVTDRVARRLTQHDRSFEYATATSVEAGIDHVHDHDVDCIVSGHDGETVDGLAFLERVREFDPDVPFVLFLDEGSEAIASRAIAADVTGYVRKDEGVDTLTERIVAARETQARRSRQRRALEDREATLRRTYEIISDTDRPFEEKVDALLRTAQDVIGTDYATLSRVRGEDYVFEVVQSPADSIEAGDVVPLAATNCERTVVTEETLVLNDIEEEAPELTEKAGFSEWGIACYLGAPVVVDGEVYGTFCFYDDAPRTAQFTDWQVTLVDLLSRWISYELERQRSTERLAAQNERLDEFASIVSHDLRNPLQVAETNLEMAQRECDSDLLDDIGAAHARMEQLITDLLTLAREGLTVDETEQVDLTAVATDAWATVETTTASLDCADERTIEADASRLQQTFENLFRNAVQHGGADVTVTVGALANGFYVEDDGPGIPDAERDRVFENGFTTGEDGTGIGLFVVESVATAHDWSVTVTESDAGGARFEFAYQ